MGYTTQLFKVPFRAFAVSGPSRPEAGGRWVGTKQTHSARIHQIMNEIEKHEVLTTTGIIKYLQRPNIQMNKITVETNHI